MNKMQQQVTEFHKAFGHPVAEAPTMIDAELAKKRFDWMHEELDEFAEAILNGDLVKAYDAVLDILYFAVGTAVVMGLDVEAGFDAVHQANMDKLGADGKPIYRDFDGKVQKPEGWTPPERRLAAVLAERLAEVAP